ncbi:MAG: hypothetical protein K2M95_00760, partial [Clostridiales bacterium]|nr:hypothetical protein [Clostridiales bacterium]
IGKIPAVGERLTFRNLEIAVTKANNKRVLECKVKVNPVEEEKESGFDKFLSGKAREEKEHSDTEAEDSSDKEKKTEEENSFKPESEQ